MGNNHDGNQQAIEISTDPKRRMGVYKRIEDVPGKFRFDSPRWAKTYEGKDTWGDFEAVELEIRPTDSHEYRLDLVGRRLKTYMELNDGHHALARPEDVEGFLEWLHINHDIGLESVYDTYWTKIERFYGWLQNHPDHEAHVYHPVLMAADQYEIAGKVWELKMETKERI